MWTRKLLGWVIALALIACFSATSIAAEFSADLLLKRAGETITGKVYVKGDKIRQEYIQQGTKQVMIFRFDKEMFWLLMPAQKVYMDIPSNQCATASDPTLDQKIKDMAVQKNLGKETVNGYICDKYQYIYKDSSMGTATQWYSQKLNYPIKSEYKSPSGYMFTEYKNIKEGGVSDSLFDVPGDYMKMSVPGMR